MDKRIPAISAAAVLVAAGAVVYALSPPAPDAPERRPISTDKSEYLLGESVFGKVRGLAPHDVGKVLVLTPNGTVFKSYPYDGRVEQDFNFYFTPDTIKTMGLCTTDDLVGTWTAGFSTGAYQPARFEMLPEYLKGSEDALPDVC